MPKKYPVEVRLFAVRKKKEGHSWNRVAEMVRQNFGLDSAPSRRQMTKWITTADAIPDAVVREIQHRLPKFAPTWMNTHEDALSAVVTEGMRGKDFRILMAKWMFWQMKEALGYDQVQAAWAEFTEEEACLQQDSNATSDKIGTPFTEEIVPEERSGQCEDT